MALLAQKLSKSVPANLRRKKKKIFFVDIQLEEGGVNALMAKNFFCASSFSEITKKLSKMFVNNFVIEFHRFHHAAVILEEHCVNTNTGSQSIYEDNFWTILEYFISA